MPTQEDQGLETVSTPTSDVSPLNLEKSLNQMHVLALGGAHQFAHVLPVACALERRFPGQVRFFVCTDSEADFVHQQVMSAGLALPKVIVIRLPFWAKALPAKSHKMARLILWGKRLCAGRVLLSAERTSTILRKLFRDCPPLVHIPHGAGDRAVGFEKRFTLFDHVLVAGHKDRDRLIESGFVTPDKCTVTGPVKLSFILAQDKPREPLFENGLPTILYNPHFSAQFSSMPSFGRHLIESVVADGRYNLVVAPHVRMAQLWTQEQRQEWMRLAVPGRVQIDLGSSACNDMTYTLGADLYIGDVSSQVYEFLVKPRPCIFVDAFNADWQDNEDYAMWHFGEVIQPSADPIAAIDRAILEHGAYVQQQKERMSYSMYGLTWEEDGSPTFKGRNVADDAAMQIALYAGVL